MVSRDHPPALQKRAGLGEGGGEAGTAVQEPEEGGPSCSAPGLGCRVGALSGPAELGLISPGPTVPESEPGQSQTWPLWAAECARARMDQQQSTGASGSGQPCLATLLPSVWGESACSARASSPVTAPAAPPHPARSGAPTLLPHWIPTQWRKPRQSRGEKRRHLTAPKPLAEPGLITSKGGGEAVARALLPAGQGPCPGKAFAGSAEARGARSGPGAAVCKGVAGAHRRTGSRPAPR